MLRSHFTCLTSFCVAVSEAYHMLQMLCQLFSQKNRGRCLPDPRRQLQSSAKASGLGRRETEITRRGASIGVAPARINRYIRGMKITDITAEQARKIAALLAITTNAFRAVVKGRRGTSSLRAIAIEKAAKRIGLDIRRESLNAGCAKCEFAKRCRKETTP